MPVDNNLVDLFFFACPECNMISNQRLPASFFNDVSADVASIAVTGVCGHDFIAYFDASKAVLKCETADLVQVHGMESIDAELHDFITCEHPSMAFACDENGQINIDMIASSMDEIEQQYMIRLKKIERLKIEMELKYIDGLVSAETMKRKISDLKAVQGRLDRFHVALHSTLRGTS